MITDLPTRNPTACSSVVLMVVRDETKGNAESTYRVESPQTPDAGFSHCRYIDLGRTYNSTDSDDNSNWDLGASTEIEIGRRDCTRFPPA
jgi:hypothetical protein